MLLTRNEKKLLDLTLTTIPSHVEGALSAEEMTIQLGRRPLRRWRLVQMLKAELVAEGLDFRQNIDWDKIGDFIIKIAPIIFEIIRQIIGMQSSQSAEDN